ncbi:T9SS type A sorting domain-containing protein [Sabulibacter ruber]|uniref:T9SS type A sorting domain-containing protein n=1 Tax=Sabulibacter ruber TaxID=2811901 RepID=UPI001A9701BE|nr:T9SS type A sorting domain-containing protein [Sabulibacter ruber]
MRFFTTTKLVYTLALFVSLILTSNGILAQIPVFEKWDRTLGGDGDDIFRSMAITPDGGIILGGFTNSGAVGDLTVGSNGSRSYWVVKLRADGTKAWDKTFSSGGMDFLSSVIPTADGGYLVGGTTWSGAAMRDKSEGTRGNDDYWVLKLDGNGNKVWDRTFGGSTKDELKVMVQSPDGGFLIGGSSFSGISGDKTGATRGQTDYWIIKLSPDGTKLWDKTIGGDYLDDLSSIALVPGGGYILGGTSGSDASGEKTEPRKGNHGSSLDYWVVKTDEEGNKLWDRSLGGEGWEQLNTVVMSPQGDILLGGNSNSDKGFDKSAGNVSAYSGGYRMDFWVVKLAADGTKLWDGTYGGNYEDQLSSILFTPDGGMLLAGSSSSGASTDKTDVSRGDLDFWVLKLDREYNKEWDKAFGGTQADVLGAALPTPDGGFLLGGYSKSDEGGDKSGYPRGGNDIWVLKVKPTDKVLPSLVPVTKIWDRRFGGSGGDRLEYMVNAHGGGYLLGGTSNSQIGGDRTEYHGSWGYEDFWLVKIGEDGSKDWDRSYGSLGTDMLRSIVKTPDGGYLLAGHSDGSVSGVKTSPRKGLWHYWVLKIDKAGKVQWDRTYGGNGSDYLAAVVPTPDGGFLLGGSSTSSVGLDKSEATRGYMDYWVVKVDARGEKQWDRTFGGDDSEFLTSLVASPQGGFLLGGYSNSKASGHKTANSSDEDFWVVQVDANGNKAWDRTIVQEGDNQLGSAVLTSDGNYLLGGNTYARETPNTTALEDFYLVKLNPGGHTLWSRRYGGHGSDRITRIIPTSDGGYLVGGESSSDGTRDKTEASRNTGTYDYWVVKLGADAGKQWDKTLGGHEHELLTSLLETPGGDFLVGGYSLSGLGWDRTQDGRGMDDYWVVRISSQAKTVTGTEEEAGKLASPLVLSPNPTQGDFYVRYGDARSVAGRVDLVLYDGSGRVVLNRAANGPELLQGVLLNSASLPKGMYFLRILGLDLPLTRKVLIR